MVAQTKPYISAAEYLAAERRAETKSEYHDGRVLAMAGASWVHNLIVADTMRALGNQLRGGPCKVVANDLRVRVDARNSYYYPDVVIVCGEPQFSDAEIDTLLYPVLLVEVLSPSTSDYDRGQKFAAYRALPSLREYLLIGQDKRRIDYYRREENGNWFIGEAQGSDAVLELVVGGGVTLALADIYAQVALAE